MLPGKLEAWVKMMEQEIIPFQISKGMVITGSFYGEADPSIYVWLRRFESEEQRVALYAEVYESDFWKNQMAPRIPEYLDRSGIVVTRIIPDREIHGAVSLIPARTTGASEPLGAVA